ncbi:MAG: PEP-CTERM/exosortase system-associated acyltransferase [Chromatiaceae bacterium]|nr:PEP-CTERM/exosortase system-associated acyltransferase [Chromatiaceae bacterium]MCP5438907.1 PEP-CTERM/exosortase system-associated acyltransferase [Chromatiaceae bacterium]HPQ26191.1 PEP-CTERM/exosortase system-associated acyltransferase [Gammaproteobacteria bacterium]
MFDETFRVCFADTPFGVALHQRIRYQVFCLDKGFEDPSAFSTAQETDAWDDQSAHFIVQNKDTRQWVAATRLVLPKRGRPLPVDSMGVFDRHRLEKPNLRVGEISRFCIINNRSQVEVNSQLHPEPNSLEAWGIGSIGKKQQFEITLGMIRAAGIYALKRDIDFCIMLITDAFARMLRTLGVKLHQAGPATDHRGMRTAYLVDMRESVVSMAKKSSAVRDLFKRSKHAYVRISSVSTDDTIDYVSEFAPDHSLFNETIFRETVLLPAEDDSDLRSSVGT